MLNPGDCIKVKTQTKDDVFGECVFKVVAVNVKCPHCKGQDGIEFSMLGGTGPSARAGYPVFDCPAKIRANIAKGITTILTPAQAQAAVNFYSVKQAPKPGAGIEM